MASCPVEVYDFKPVTLEAVRDALNENLGAYYEEVKVSVVDCPDLTQSPFELPVQGFGGGACDLVDLGGVPYLLPTVDKSRVYDFRDVVAKIGSERYPQGWYLNGAGAGPFPLLGSNSELILSMKIGPDGQVEKNGSKVSLTSPGDEKDVDFKALDEPRCALLANFLVSSPVPGKVLEISLRRRTDPKTDFTKSIREALDKAFPGQPVGLGGLFIVKKAPTYTHIMRDFSETPLHSDEEVDQWLKFFEMDPPFMCQSVLYSSDPGLDLRIDHSHGWSLNPEKKEGGHYHHDLAADDVEYVGYYVVAEKLWRIDRPAQSQ